MGLAYRVPWFFALGISCYSFVMGWAYMVPWFFALGISFYWFMTCNHPTILLGSLAVTLDMLYFSHVEQLASLQWNLIRLYKKLFCSSCRIAVIFIMFLIFVHMSLVYVVEYRYNLLIATYFSESCAIYIFLNWYQHKSNVY